MREGGKGEDIHTIHSDIISTSASPSPPHLPSPLSFLLEVDDFYDHAAHPPFLPNNPSSPALGG